MVKRRAIRAALACLMATLAAQAATLTLLPQGDITGTAGATVGWGFTIANTTNGQWIEITSANFCTGTSGTSTACTAASLGTFTDFVSGYNDVVVGASPDTTSVTQSFNNSAHTGIGSFRITASSGQTGAGQLVLTYNVFSRSPHSASFNPDTDTVSTDNFLTAAASVTVVAAPPPATPVPPSMALTLTGLFVLGGWQLCRRRLAGQKAPFRVFALVAALPLMMPSNAQAQPNWLRKAASPSQRVFFAMGYDSARHQTVVFGGQLAATNVYQGYLVWGNDTWVFDGWQWIQKFPAHQPIQRNYSAMAFDPVYQRLILYGGGLCPPATNCPYGGTDTWAWDGTDWTQLFPAHNPGPTAGQNTSFAMATDTARSRIVLFDQLAETWEWDGNDWTQKHPLASPPGRSEAGMAYDAQRGYTVLFGGRSGSTNYGDTWLWDGSNWTLAGMFYGPPKRAYHHMAYDAERRQVLVFGGFDTGVAWYNDLWAWDGVKWNQVQAACNTDGCVQPLQREGGGMVYDELRKSTILFGGYRYPHNFLIDTYNYLDDTWSWDGSTWTPLAAPLHRLGPSLVWDSTHNQAVMFGGWVQDGGYYGSYWETNETWVWDGASWTLKHPAHQPPPRQLAGIAYDAARQRTVIFGGLQGSTKLADMWAWDGTDWTQLTPGTMPSARQAPLMTYDAANQRVVLFGGTGASGGLNDTWIWNGTAWTQLNPANPPGAYDGYGIAYDPVRQRVMMAQYHYVGVLDATNNWTALAAPPVAFVGPMVWDSAMGMMVLMNRWSTTVNAVYNMWTWDGTTWAAFNPTTKPPKRDSTPMIYDPVRNQVLLYGGNLMDVMADGYPTNDTWVLTAPETTGDIYVQTNRPEAFYTVSGQTSYSGSGTASNWSGVTPGGYTNMYGGVTGYVTPNSVTQTLTAGSVIAFVSGYAAIPGTIQVTSNLATSFTISGPINYSGSGTSYSRSNVPAGVYTISFVPIAGYVTPAPQTQTLQNAGLIGFTATYTALPTTCTLTVGTNVAGATFSVAGAASYAGGGTSYSQPGIPPGTYTITFNPVAGYITPSSQTSTVSSGGTLAFTGTYQLGSPATNVGWVLKSPAPYGRANSSAVYDAARGQVVMFGGTRGNAINETWVYDGSSWIHKHPQHNPTAGDLRAMVYDAARQKVVLVEYGSPTLDTWLWDGADWTHASPSTSPPGPDWIYAIPLAYDAARQQVVLVNDCDKTWVWDGSNWSQKTPANSPPDPDIDNTQGCLVAYDAARSQVTLVSRYYTGPPWTVVYGTWNWDGTNWTQTSVSSTVPGFSMTEPIVYDPARQQIAVVSGAATWVWDGAAWTQKTPANSPSARTYSQLVLDPLSTQLLLIGGTANGIELSNDIWTWDGTNWSQRASTPSYPVRNAATLVYDAAHAEVVQFGGQWKSDTWTWNGTTWTQKNPATVPPLRSDFPMVYDAARRQVVMFGGDGYYLWLNDTWVWDGANWTQKFPTQVPTYRRGNMMAYDAAHQVVVLFGGKGYSGVLNDTWTWDGSNWTQMNPATSPAAREMGSMFYDAARGKVILFGGGNTSASPNTFFNDTWQWDGSTWTRLNPAASPSARVVAGTAYDTLRGQTLLYGGNTAASGYTFAQDTWIWDGANWTQQTSADTPPAVIVGMTYDAARGQVMTFGGWTAYQHYFAEDVWVWDQLPTQPTTGTINVTTNLAGAGFTLTGAATYTGSGTSWSQANAPAGSYTIVYSAVSGYATPASQTLILAAGATIAFTGTYTATTGTITVTTNVAGAGFTLTGAASYTGSGISWSQANAPAGSYTITYNAVTGYAAPASQTLTLAAGATVTFTGTYTPVVSQFAVSAPASATVGTAFKFTVTAKDAANNTMTGYTGTVHFTSNDTAATLPADATLTNGTGTFFATLRTAGTRTITATDTVTATIVGTSGAISVGASAAGLNISVTHTGNFTQGEQNDTYSVTVSNGAAAAPTSGTVTVTETIPVGLTLVSMAGTGWTCAGSTCSRADALAAGTAWPPITVTVNVGINALSPQVNQVSLSGGGSAAASATDSTVVNPMAGGAAVLFGTIAGKQGTQAARVWTFSIGNSGTGAAAAAQITGIALTQTAGAACTPVVTSPASFPLALGNIPAGAFAQTNMTINFTGCANAALFTVRVQLSANGGNATAVILRNDEER